MKVYLSAKAQSGNYYHTNKDCHNLDDDYLEKDKELIEPIYTLCACCDDGIDTTELRQEHEKECPYCEWTGSRLHVHLPCEKVP